jgi:MFS family permease
MNTDTTGPHNSLAIRGITRRYYVMRLFDAIGPSFIFGIYPLFMHARGLNQFQMNCVAATFFLMTFMTDIPTGAFADAVGRRVSYVLGCALSVGAFVIYFFAFRIQLFFIGEIVDAVGGTLRNGALDAWAVDALDDAGHVGTKDVIFSRVSQVWRFGAMTGALVGAYAARADIALPWLLGAAGQVAMGIAALILMRGEKRRGIRPTIHTIGAQVRERVIGGVREGVSNRIILLLAIANAVTLAAWAPYWFEWPQFFNAGFNSGPQVVGWVFALFAVAGMIGAEVTARWEPAPSRRALLLGLGVAIQGSFFFMAGVFNHRTWLVMGLFFAANMAAGSLGPVYLSWYNEEIDESRRATMLSFQTTFATFGSAAGLPIGGAIADRFGLAIAWKFGGVLSILASPFYLALRGRPHAEIVSSERSAPPSDAEELPRSRAKS